MNQEELRREYESRYEDILRPLAQTLTLQLQDHLRDIEQIDRISARAKNPERFVSKALKDKVNGENKYPRPLEQIQDLVGARVIVFYKQDVDIVSAAIEKYYRPIERRDLIPESESEFGYVGKHYILACPEDLFGDDVDRSRCPLFFELQIKTLFQHAWSEAAHDLSYKPEVPLNSMQKRLVALTSAQAWGADLHFAQLHSELNGAQRAELNAG
jgi:putative GTP pyrophosphokinase